MRTVKSTSIFVIAECYKINLLTQDQDTSNWRIRQRLMELSTGAAKLQIMATFIDHWLAHEQPDS
jgi:hypothetical protein